MSPSLKETNGMHPLTLKESQFDEGISRRVEKDLTQSSKNKLEILYDGYFYDVTEFIGRHPGGDIIRFYTERGEDATIAIQQFHYRSLKKVMGKMRGLKRRLATDDEIGLDPETKKRHDKLTKDFLALAEEVEAEGLMEPNPLKFGFRLFLVLLMMGGGLAMYFVNLPLIWVLLGKAVGIIGSGQLAFLLHQAGHNEFTGNPKFDRIVQILGYGLVSGLSASCWNSTHVEHHAMTQHETRDADLKTLPLLAFNTKFVRNKREHSRNLLLHYQHFLFVLCDTLIVLLTWRFNHHPKFVIKNKLWLELVCMMCHYSIIFLIGLTDWILVSWISSIYILGNLVLSHTYTPVVEEGRKLHWVEYALCHTVNFKSSYFGWVDWWTGYINYQIEHHLFPSMPEHNGPLCRDKVKAFAKRNQLPYQLCSYWDGVKSTYNNLERVGKEIREL